MSSTLNSVSHSLPELRVAGSFILLDSRNIAVGQGLLCILVDCLPEVNLLVGVNWYDGIARNVVA